MPELPTFDPTWPAIAQNDPWSCSCTSVRWMLFSLGRQPSEQWIEQTMIAEGVANPDVGCTDKSGAGLAAFVERHYGYAAGSNGYAATFDELAHVAGERPYAISGGAWYHWSGLRGYDATTDRLLLANPASGWHGIKQTMTRAEFAQLGPWSYCWIEAQLAGAAPAPIPPDDEYAVGPGVRSAMIEDGTWPASDELYVHSGAHTAWSQTLAADGGLYVWNASTGQTVRYRPAP